MSKLLTTLALAVMIATALDAAESAAVERQNAFVKTRCAVCHTDRANNGGLSLEGFDATVVAPSLAAMMLSKITSGTALATVNAASHDAAAASKLASGVGKGAINAAGLGKPGKDVEDAIVAAFTAQSANARRWSVEHTMHRSTGADIVTASIVRELPSTTQSGRRDIEAAMYRLVLTCNATAREGAMQLAWSPIPKEGPLAIAVDHQPAQTFMVEGKERMGNGTSGTTGPAAFVFARFGGAQTGRIQLPKRSLTASGLFAGETVTFPFDQLTKAARESLSACFR